ncbi:protein DETOXIFICATION 18-like [Gossypium raimondii]|uniref:protein DETOXIFICATION 18-like n=1 Tax=Gossypium raimondii TaxID=29730 RepID=UPI00227AA1E3|nr:protein DETOXIFICATION 18-like [Gossypium raimondii]
MAVSLKLSILLALTVVVALAFGHNIWAAFFTNTASIINQFASITPFLLISITIDSFQGILSGVARGSGWQVLAAWANLGTFYLIGMPVAGLLAFKFNLYAKGHGNGVRRACCRYCILSRNSCLYRAAIESRASSSSGEDTEEGS